MSNLELSHVYKVYPNGVKAVNDFTMKIEDKEFIVFVGPSGCGKSTTLRMIAGLEEITSGEIKIDDMIVNDAEPKERDIAMVFQNYALYPHMSVYKNMAFGLKLRHMPKAEIDERVRNIAEILGLSEYLDRKPKAMSGGQRQRVALGRAIVREPKVFLLDEPLSNLDAKLRAQMRSQISKLHNRLQTTFIYVTHDQVEAMTMGTRIVVMKEGFVQQIDTPKNLYRYPINKFVAGFIGTPQMNFLNVKLKKTEGKKVEVIFEKLDLSFLAPLDLFSRADEKYLNGDVTVCFGIRSEHISSDSNKYPYKAMCKIGHIEDLGVDAQIYADLNLNDDDLVGESPTRIIYRAPTGYSHQSGDEVEVSFDLEHMHLFDSENEESISKLLPTFVKTKGMVKGGKVSIYGHSFALPPAMKEISDGEYTLTIPTDAITAGGEIEAKISSVLAATDKNVLTLKIGDEYAFVSSQLSEKHKEGDTIKIALDFKRIAFDSSFSSFSPLQEETSLTVKVNKKSLMKEHVNMNGRVTKIKEYYCEFETSAGKIIPVDASTGLKLVNLMSNKAFKEEIEIRFSPYAARICDGDQGGIEAKLVSILDYGKEKFAKCENDEAKEIIVSLDKDYDVGQNVYIALDTKQIHAYNTKNQIRLL